VAGAEAPVRAVPFLLLLTACDDWILPPGGGGGGDTDVAAEGWCGVQSILNARCVACHGNGYHLADLDLQTDPYAALVGVAAPSGHGTLVAAGDPEGSLLYRKVSGTQAASEGASMPPGGLGDAEVAAIRAWIADGASDACSGPVDTDVVRHHPDGWAEPTAHGQAAELQTEPCVACHGADLTGQGDAASCDGCHAEGWRTDCTFCHGDPADGTGAPPVHLSGVDDGAAATFVPHRTHTDTTAVHLAFDCTACHAKPTDVLTPGHVFVGDASPGHAETDFALSLSDAAVWNRSTGTCSDLYCHGARGLDDGLRRHDQPIPDGQCSACHPDRTSGSKAWDDRMSDPHRKHLEVDDGGVVRCWECHGATVDASMAVLDPALHVNGVPDVLLRDGMSRTNGLCTGTCHGESHEAGRRWR
jgi:hypothetical protein